MSFLAFLTPAIVGLHLASVHVPDRNQNNVNPGVYVITQGGQIAGYYRNSFERDTFYVGQTVKAGPLDVGLVLASGYRNHCDGTNCGGMSRYAINPVVAVSYALPVTLFNARPRVWVAPGFGKHSTVGHLSLEWSMQ